MLTPLNQFTHFEFNAVIEIDRFNGRPVYEAVPCLEPGEKADMWAVYGRLKAGGVECLADCATEDVAKQITHALNVYYACYDETIDQNGEEVKP